MRVASVIDYWSFKKLDLSRVWLAGRAEVNCQATVNWLAKVNWLARVSWPGDSQ
jgi:hypothetical protein